ncbi:MAG: ComEC/Rec2 family competence protein [Actinomycetota bacterium]
MRDLGSVQAWRALALAGGFACGTLAAERAGTGAAVAGGIAAVALMLAIIAPRRAGVLLVAAAALGFALTSWRLSSVAGGELARASRARADGLLRGEVLTDARRSGDGIAFLLGVREAELDGRPVRLRERAWVSVRPPPARAPEAGDLVRVDARLRPVFFADLDADGRAAALRLWRSGAGARAMAGPADLEVIGRSSGPLAVVARAGRAAVRSAASHLPPRDAGLLLGITIGDTTALDPDIDLDFRTAGLSHLVAVSGANLAMVLAAVGLALRVVGAGRRTGVVAMALCSLGFMAVARFEPSVLRAGVMTAVALAGVAVGARREAMAALAVTVFACLVYDPFLLHSPGFQLSTLATWGILAFEPRVSAMLPPGNVARAAAVTIGAQIAVGPLIALRFQQVSLIAVAANVAAGPAVAPATVIGMLAAAAAAAWSPLGRLSIAAWPALAWMRWVAHALAQLPLASVDVPGGVPGIVVVLMLVALAVAVARGWRPRRAAPIVLALALAATGGVWARALAPPPPTGLVVTMLDVGQGDALLVRAPGGATMLVDGGPDEAVLLKALRAQNTYRIDLLVVTHPHADHVDGLVAVAERMPIGRALDPFLEESQSRYSEFVQALDRRGIARARASAGATYALGPATIEVLWPPDPLLRDTASDPNNNSIVMRVRYGSDAVLLTGDVQEEAQEGLLERPEHLRAGVVKVAHHGSAYMLPEFYAATGARIALISVGRNRFGHPTQAALAAVSSMRVLRSDRSGTVRVALDGAGGIDVRAEHSVEKAA